MGAVTKEDKLRIISEAVSQTAGRIGQDAVRQFEEENPQVSVPQEVRALVCQRAASELMFRTCNFKGSEGATEEADFCGEFDAWFANEEEGRLRTMCRGIIKSELDKRRVSEDENLTFTERYLKKVREDGRKQSVISLLEDL